MTTRSLPSPLTTGDLAVAAQVAARLRAAFEALLAALPENARGASSMARHLEVDRTACQRLLSALTGPPVGPVTLTQVAGVKALLQLRDAARARGVDAAAVLGFEAAVLEFERFLRAVGGSRQTLAERLRATGPKAMSPLPGGTAPGDDPDLADRMQVFDGARRLVGRWARTAMAIGIHGPEGGDMSKQVCVTASGSLGQRQLPGAVPLIYYQRWGPGEAVRYGRGEATGRNTDLLLAEFCSTPMPVVVTTPTPRGLMHVIDPVDKEAPFDVLCTNRATLPLSTLLAPPSLVAGWAVIQYPAESALLEMYLHVDLARRSIPGADVHLNVMGNPFPQDEGWETRMSRPPSLQVLGPGLSRAASPLDPRHVELLGHLFRREGWNPDDFVGYRCELRYPGWRLAYRIYSDFRGSANQTGP